MTTDVGLRKCWQDLQRLQAEWEHSQATDKSVLEQEIWEALHNINKILDEKG